MKADLDQGVIRKIKKRLVSEIRKADCLTRAMCA